MGTNARSVGIALKRRLDDLYTQIAGLKAAADTWTLNDDDTLLPADATLKTAIEVYNGINLVPLRLSEEIHEILSGESEPLPELPPVPVNVSTEWASIQNKPTAYPPETHTHTNIVADSVEWEDVLNKPTAYPAAAQLPSPVQMGSVQIMARTAPDGFPLQFSRNSGQTWEYEFPPMNHNHVVNWTDIQQTPASYPPSEHSHAVAWGEITGKPTLTKVAEIHWQGDGSSGRTITLPFALATNYTADIASNRSGIYGRIFSNGNLIRTDGVVVTGVVGLISTTMTLTAETNATGHYYYLILRGAA